jgi:hypothetical protein
MPFKKPCKKCEKKFKPKSYSNDYCEKCLKEIKSKKKLKCSNCKKLMEWNKVHMCNKCQKEIRIRKNIHNWLKSKEKTK